MKEGKIPEKVFVRVHGMGPSERRVLIRRSKNGDEKQPIASWTGAMMSNFQR
jgi:hypothetical protein